MAEKQTIVQIANEKFKEIEKVIDICSLSNLEDTAGRFARAFILANGIRKLTALITDDMMKESIMPLQGLRLGFRTDKDRDDGYPLHIVKQCLIEATLRGAYPIGNEFNIIAASPYITKEGFTRMLREYPGLKDLKKKFGVPNNKSGGAIVECSATWILNDQADEVSREFPIRVNQGMGSDAILGKANRKLMAAIWEQITGSELTDGAIEDQPPIKTVGNEEPGQRSQSLVDQIRGDDPGPKNDIPKDQDVDKTTDPETPTKQPTEDTPQTESKPPDDPGTNQDDGEISAADELIEMLATKIDVGTEIASGLIDAYCKLNKMAWPNGSDEQMMDIGFAINDGKITADS